MEGQVQVENTGDEVMQTNNSRLSLPDVLTDVKVANDSQDLSEEQESRLENNSSAETKVPINDGTSDVCPEESDVFSKKEEIPGIIVHTALPADAPVDSPHTSNILTPQVIAQDTSEITEVHSSGGIYEGPTSPKYEFEKPFSAQLITGAWEEFKGDCEELFTKGCKWSPDGTCILTNSEDKILRIFDLPGALHCQEAWPVGRTLPELRPALRIKEGGRVYDYCWFPFMSSWDPLSCCLVACSQFAPVHLWDAYSGQLRATYRAYNCMDEIEHAFSVAFDLSGQKLYCGFKKRLCVFDTGRPGSSCETRMLKGLGRPVGIVSCICVNPADVNMYAFSSYSRTIGSTDGRVLVWDTQKAAHTSLGSEVPVLPLLSTFPAHGDCVNGISLHKQYPLLSTTSGQRHPYCPDCDSDEEGSPGKKRRHTQREDTLKLWWMGSSSLPSP